MINRNANTEIKKYDAKASGTGVLSINILSNNTINILGIIIIISLLGLILVVLEG